MFWFLGYIQANRALHYTQGIRNLNEKTSTHRFTTHNAYLMRNSFP
jgi:hypothetical protein